MTDQKPAVSPAAPAEARKRPPRVPMSTARLRMQCKEIPGYRLYWFREENVSRALEAYYEFVKPEEVQLSQLNVANAAHQSGGTDMGTRVSMTTDKTDTGAPIRAYLMKIALEYFKDDQAEIARRNALVLEAMFGEEANSDVSISDDGRVIVRDRDPLTYVDSNRTGIFNRKTRKIQRLGKGRLT